MSILILTGCALFLVATVDRHPVHQFENECGNCHLGMGDPSLMIGDVDILCLRCHSDETSRSHPSDFRVKQTLSPRFPLFNGKMMCTTCHYAHEALGESNQQKIASASYPYLLRFSQAGKRFCFQCHNADDFGSGAGSHGISLGIAHTENIAPELLDSLDRSSRDCLGCHDGTISGIVETGGASWKHARGIGLSHPIGVYYADACRKSPEKYHSESSLPKALRLVDGRVECVTCHDHYSRLKGLLVMDNRGSHLCLSCHNL